MTFEELIEVCGNEIDELKPNAAKTAPKPAQKMKTATMYPTWSNAVKTIMFTKCKACGKANGNGYQYCDACHQTHGRRRR
jgi:hypothetical protein